MRDGPKGKLQPGNVKMKLVQKFDYLVEFFLKDDRICDNL